MSSSGEDRGASDGVDAIVLHKGDDPSGSTGGEDVVTLILTPVDLSCDL